MEKKLLLFLLYSVLIEVRGRSYERKDNVSFHLCDLVHNIPLVIDDEDNILDVYKDLLQKVEHLGVESWLESRLLEFRERFPEFE